MATRNDPWILAARTHELDNHGQRAVVQVLGRTLLLLRHQGEIFALDNRCPHMGFPLHQGSVDDGILTCHWHHARFDVCSGGTFDPWADDVESFPTDLRGEEIWVRLEEHSTNRSRRAMRLNTGLKRNLALVLAKSVQSGAGPGLSESFQAGLQYGARYRGPGWGQGLTILTCLQNMLPVLAREDHPLALYHGLAAVAADTHSQPPRFPLEPLPGSTRDLATLKRWFRQFIEVRDDEGAERALLTALEAGAGDRILADMLFSAATDHRYIQTGHPLDFTNKALEALDHTGWALAGEVLPTLVLGYAEASRMEENNAWRHPEDLVSILDEAFAALPEAYRKGQQRQPPAAVPPDLQDILLGEDPRAIAQGLLEALSAGTAPTELAGQVAYAAAMRIARFHTSNEFGDWDTALHTFTFANAVHQGLRRSPKPLGDDPFPPLLRGVWDAAMSVYLDRFLNVPAAPLPGLEASDVNPAEILKELPALLNRQQQVDAAGRLVGEYLRSGGDPGPLLATIGRLLLREDRDFHTIQAVEASFRQFQVLSGRQEAPYVVIAAARYLAAHAPTMRAQEQTFKIARRLSQGEKLFEQSS